MKRNLLTLLVAVVFAVAAAEVGLRLAGISFPEFNRLDARLGWSPRPGLEGLHGIEARVPIRINGAGFRDREHGLAKAPGTFRIAVIGDSMTEAREVPLAATYWSVMQARLDVCVGDKGPRPEVLAFAANGYGTVQELILLQSTVLAYHPDIVMVAVFTGNDIQNNSAQLDGHPHRPYARLQGNTLVIDDSNLRGLDFRIARRWYAVKHGLYNFFRTLQLGRQAYRNVKSRLRFGGLSLMDQLAFGLPPGVYREPDEEPWADAWRVTEATLRTMAATVRRAGGEMWLVTLSNPIQVYPDPALRQAYAESQGIADLDYPDKRLRTLGELRQTPVINLAPPLRAYAEANHVNLHGTATFAGGHWNAEGHRAAGEFLARALCQELAPPPRS